MSRHPGFCDVLITINVGARSGETSNTPSDVVYAGKVNDPVNTFTGDLFKHYAPDFDLGGPMALVFSRFYASGLAAENMGASVAGRIARNWRHNYQWELNRAGDSLEIISAVGRRIAFNRSGALWVLAGRTDIPFQLVEDINSGDFTLSDPRDDRTFRFNADGQLLLIQDSVGNSHSLSYDVSDLLLQVADGLGRALNFSYGPMVDELTRVDDGNGRQIQFSIGGNNNIELVSFTDVLGKVTTFSYADPMLVNTAGVLLAEQHPIGNTPYTQTYVSNLANTGSLVASQADALANTTTFSYGFIQSRYYDH